MSTWLPFPVLSACLMAMWLLMNQTIAPSHILLGAILALVGGWMARALRPARPRVRRPGAMLRLFLLVFADVVRSNIAVARIILGPRHRKVTSGFVNIPLQLRDPRGLAALSCIITATPGTLWVNFEPATGILMIHVLDLIDESAWVRTIKDRYEGLLLEIFE